MALASEAFGSPQALLRCWWNGEGILTDPAYDGCQLIQ